MTDRGAFPSGSQPFSKAASHLPGTSLSIRLWLLHGFLGQPSDWDDVKNALKDELGPTGQVIPLQLPGHGTSSHRVPDDYSMTKAADEVVATVLAQEKKAGIVNVLGGYSMGGRLALHVILQAPSLWSGLILESATYGIDDARAREQRKKHDTSLALRLETIGVEAFVDEWEQLPLFASQHSMPTERKEAQRRSRLAHDAHALASALRTMGTGVQQNVFSRLSSVSVPTLLVVGALDEKFVGIAEKMTQSLRDAKLHVVPQTGHNVHLEQPERYADIVRSFLRRLKDGAS